MSIRARRRSARLVAALLILVGAAAPPSHADQPLSDQLRQLLEAQRAGVPVTVGGRQLQAASSVQDFYAARVYKPAWFVDGKLSDSARAIVPLLASAADDGLRPDDYRYTSLSHAIAAYGSGVTGDVSPVELEVALTDAVLTYASDMLRGRVRPETLYPSWESAPPELDLVQYLQQAIAAGRLIPGLRGLAPQHPDYLRLKQLLARYRQIESRGGLVDVPPGEPLKARMRSPRVAALRRRLVQSGDLGPDQYADPDLYDAALESAVKHYQARHGIEPDGIAGAVTLESLDAPAARWIRLIELNMERWRWLPQNLGDHYITVNIAGFQLYVVEGGNVQLSMPVVVGKRYHETPVFSATMTYIVFNPYWEVPTSIAVKEILPKLKRDPTYLDGESMKVFRGWGQPDTPIDPATIDWTNVSAKGFPYRFRQEPGPKNALGRVKFMFPNKYNVYLHDTPAKELFSKTSRGFSHGCIRVSRPNELAGYLLRDQPGWGANRILEAEAEGTGQAVRLAHRWPVHILYWTAWVGPDGEAQFRPDVYGRDERLSRALFN